MDVNHINPILESFTNILPQLGFSEIRRLNVGVKGRYIESPGVVIIIGLIGDIKGNIIYAINTEDAKKIASTMMMGMPVETFDELSQSAISELINMLTANMATNFSKDNVIIDISTPTLIEGTFTANASADKVLCITMGVGELVIDVNVSLEKNTF